MPTLTSPTGIKEVAAGRGIQQRIAKAIAAVAVRMFILSVVQSGGRDKSRMHQFMR
jgi:hypothetical protein